MLRRRILPGPTTDKPVIYLYPIEEQIVSVKLDFKGKLTCTYPEYKDGWLVKAKPDGTLINIEDDREYSYLYWEGISDYNWDMSKGFVVKGSDTAKEEGRHKGNLFYYKHFINESKAIHTKPESLCIFL